MIAKPGSGLRPKARRRRRATWRSRTAQQDGAAGHRIGPVPASAGTSHRRYANAQGRKATPAKPRPPADARPDRAQPPYRAWLAPGAAGPYAPATAPPGQPHATIQSPSSALQAAPDA